MNPPSNSPLSNPLISSADAAVQQASGAIAGTMETAREKLQEARHLAHEKMEAVGQRASDAAHIAREKMEAVGQRASEVAHVAREKIEGAGSGLLQWARENPATALATLFASGFVIGCALTMQRHERTFSERFHDDPRAALRDALHSALQPIRERVHDAAESMRSATEDVGDRISSNGRSLGSRLRHLWN